MILVVGRKVANVIAMPSEVVALDDWPNVNTTLHRSFFNNYTTRLGSDSCILMGNCNLQSYVFDSEKRQASEDLE